MKSTPSFSCPKEGLVVYYQWGLACYKCLDSGEQVKSSIFCSHPNFLPAPHHLNTWNRLSEGGVVLLRKLWRFSNQPLTSYLPFRNELPYYFEIVKVDPLLYINYCGGNTNILATNCSKVHLILFLQQCSAYQVVTSKIYGLQPLEGLLKLKKVD